jgi:hypothetical protein
MASIWVSYKWITPWNRIVYHPKDKLEGTEKKSQSRKNESKSQVLAITATMTFHNKPVLWHRILYRIDII